MKIKYTVPNAKLIKGGMEYLRGRMTGKKRVKLKGLALFLRGRYL